MDQLTQILSEIRDLREDHNEFARETVERLTALEVGLKSLTGNGQPGRIQAIEGEVKQQGEDISHLKQWKFYVVGFSVAIGAVAGFFAHVIPEFLR
jgi:hypothetical protein